MRTASGKDLAPVYSVAFLVVVMLLLVSFLTVPAASLSSLATEFRWRHELIQLYSTLRWKAGDRLFNLFVIGSDGWIMFTGDRSIPDFQHTDRLRNTDLKQLQVGLDALDQSLRQQDRTLLVVIVPNKNTVYPQYMPTEIPVLRKDSQLDQFDEYMKANSKVRILDLRPALIQASHSQAVYYKTDTHWNSAGAYIGYVKVLNALSPEFPALKPHPLTDFDRTYFPGLTLDLPRSMGLPQIKEDVWGLMPRFPVQGRTQDIPLPNGALTFTTNPAPELPSLLIFHDSFYVGLAKLMLPHFSRITAVPNIVDPTIWTTAWVQAQPSDIVIIELTERNLQLLFPLLNDHQ